MTHDGPWWVVANPGAGGRSDGPARARTALAARGIPADVHETASPGHVAEVVAAGVEAGRRSFVAVGGDGTVNLVVDALLRHRWEEPPLLGVLPAGTGCDLVRTFGISQRLEEAAAHLVGPDRYRVDAGYLQGPWGDRYFLNVAQAGLGGAVVQRAERLPARLGAIRYKLAIWPSLVRFRRTPVVVETERRKYEGPAMMVVFANAQFFGGGMNVAPKATLVDGKIDLQIFTGKKRHALVLQPRVTRGTHLTHREVRRHSVASFTLRSERPWPVEADGEFLGEGDIVTGTVVPGALDLKI